MVQSKYKCNLDLLTDTDKEKRDKLLEKLTFSITDINETDKGYNISIFSNVMNLIEIENLKDIESKCCPFLDFEISSEGGYTVLKIIGPEDAKDYIKQEFGLLL